MSLAGFVDYRWSFSMKPRRGARILQRKGSESNHETCSTVSAWLSLNVVAVVIQFLRADVEFAARMAVRSREHPTTNSERRTRRGGGTFAKVEERSPRSEAGSRRDWETRDRGNESHPRRCERVAETRRCVGARKRKARGREGRRERERERTKKRCARSREFENRTDGINCTLFSSLRGENSRERSWTLARVTIVTRGFLSHRVLRFAKRVVHPPPAPVFPRTVRLSIRLTAPSRFCSGPHRPPILPSPLSSSSTTAPTLK